MARLMYSAIMSLDGYVADEGGKFDWAEPDEEVHTFINDLEERIGTYLLGRGMYQVMAAWESDDLLKGMPAYIHEFARLWRAADKIVFSRSLQGVLTSRTRLEREFDPHAVRQLKLSTARDIAVGGPSLAAHAFEAGLVDECHFFIVPVIVGAGKPAFPPHIWLQLELLALRRFRSGMVHLAYTTKLR